MTAGTAEVVKVEDLEELLGSDLPLCEVKDPPEPGILCKMPAGVLIRYKCDCLNTGTGRKAWICKPHYTYLRSCDRFMLEFKCSHCLVPIRNWIEL